MSRLGAMDAGIRPVWPSPRIIGAALTVWCHSGDNLMLHKALSLAQPGDIVVMNTQGNVDNSGFGELLATSAVKFGVRGVIVDGMVRDADALQTLGLPVYARGLCPIGCNKDGAGEVGAIIACGGVAVRPGDVIWPTATESPWFRWTTRQRWPRWRRPRWSGSRSGSPRLRNGVLVRPEIDETLRKLKVID